MYWRIDVTFKADKDLVFDYLIYDN